MSAANSGTPEASTSQASQGPAKSGGGSKLGLIISGINLIATFGMLAILFMSFQLEKHKPSVDDIALKASGEAPAHGSEPTKGHGAEAKEGGGEHGSKESSESSKKKATEFGKMVTLDPFTVNLSTPGSVNPKFVRANISLELPSEDVEVETVSKMPQIRNVIIDLFNSKRPSDLSTVDGREYIKEEIKNAINSFMVTGKVKGVYFTSFALAS